jgi:hypothetical protein
MLVIAAVVLGVWAVGIWMMLPELRYFSQLLLDHRSS